MQYTQLYNTIYICIIHVYDIRTQFHLERLSISLFFETDLRKYTTHRKKLQHRKIIHKSYTQVIAKRE